MHRHPALVLARRPRGAIGRSRIGGLPRLGDVPWPRTSAGEPMVFVAQLDLAELEAASGRGAFRGAGALAFFLSVHADPPGAVRHVRAPWAPTLPPPDVPTLEDLTQLDRCPHDERGATARTLPQWGVELVPSRIPPEREGEDGEALAAWVADRFVTRGVYATPKAAAEAVGRPVAVPWQAQRRLVGALRARLADARHAERHPEVEPTREAFRGFVEEIAAAGAPHDRWAPMSEADLERLEGWLAEIRPHRARPNAPPSRFGAWMGYSTIWRADLVQQAFWDALRAGGVDKDVARWADATLRLGVGGWHQVFGNGVAVQGNVAAEREGDHLLLQLVTDDLASWLFGDNGAWHWFIRPADLAAGRFEAAEVEFESH